MAVLIGLAGSVQLLVAVAILVVAALVVAFFARAAVRRKAPPAAEQLPEKRELPKIEVPEVVAPAERIAREQRAREDLEKAQTSLQSARELLSRDAGSAAARAEVQRYERDVADLQRKVEYEQRKTAEAL